MQFSTPVSMFCDACGRGHYKQYNGAISLESHEHNGVFDSECEQCGNRIVYRVAGRIKVELDFQRVDASDIVRLKHGSVE